MVPNNILKNTRVCILFLSNILPGSNLTINYPNNEFLTLQQKNLGVKTIKKNYADTTESHLGYTEMSDESGTRSLFPVLPAVNAHLGAGGTATPASLQINQVNVTNPVGQSMTNLYYQCRTERESTFKNNATELGGCASFGFEAGGKSQGWLSRVRQDRIRQVLHGRVHHIWVFFE